MAELDDNIEDDLDDDDWEPEPPFSEELYNYLCSPVKQFLVNYYGEALNNASAQTFRDIETQIKESIFLEADILPGYLYQYRTITDSKEWEKALQNYKFSSTAVVAWPAKEQWYDRPLDDDEEEEEDMEIDESELTDDQEKAEDIIKAADNMLNEHAQFADFVKKCCTVIISNTQTYLQTNAAFDLAVLSPEGFEKVQDHIALMAQELSDSLYGITEELREK